VTLACSDHDQNPGNEHDPHTYVIRRIRVRVSTKFPPAATALEDGFGVSDADDVAGLERLFFGTFVTIDVNTAVDPESARAVVAVDLANAGVCATRPGRREPR
jgi:hypothetical protein